MDSQEQNFLDQTWSNLFQKIFSFVDGGLEKISGNWGRWSNIVLVMLPDISFGVIKSE